MRRRATSWTSNSPRPATAPNARRRYAPSSDSTSHSLPSTCDWAGNLLRGDFGISLFNERPIGDSIRDRLPLTIELAVGAAAVGALLGIFVGVVAAVWHDRPVDYIARSISVAAISIPSFVFALSASSLSHPNCSGRRSHCNTSGSMSSPSM